MRSLNDLMEKAFMLSLQLSYETVAPNGSFLDTRQQWGSASENDQNMVFGWADGLVHKYYNNVLDGRCSLSAIINFDFEKFEARVAKDVVRMTELLTQLPAPRKLTFEEMRAQGYKGSWAGLHN